MSGRFFSDSRTFVGQDLTTSASFAAYIYLRAPKVFGKEGIAGAGSAFGVKRVMTQIETDISMPAWPASAGRGEDRERHAFYKRDSAVRKQGVVFPGTGY